MKKYLQVGALADIITTSSTRKLGRAVECTGLENRQGCEPFVSSNLTASANKLRNIVSSISKLLISEAH